jgi:hypothetical protein
LTHAAALTIRAEWGMGVFEIAKEYHGRLRVKALEKASKNWKRPRSILDSDTIQLPSDEKSHSVRLTGNRTLS